MRSWAAGIVLTLSLSLAIPALGQAAAEPPRDVSGVLTPIREKHRLPALAAVVVEGGTIAAEGVVGVRREGSPEPATIEDQWHIGSCTKSMTATLVALLVERGKLSWDSTVWESFSEFHATMDPAWKQVTVEHLLTNRGGAPADLDADGLWGRLWRFRGTPTAARLALVEGVTKHPPKAGPGEKFIYSNAGFAIAGAMAEKATGKAWEDLMREMIFGPLGMSSAGFGAPGTNEAIDQPRGHRAGSPPTPVDLGPGGDNPAAIGPAGTVHTSLRHWAKYASAHLHGARGDPLPDAPIRLSPETWKKLQAPAGAGVSPDEGYAMGWGVTRPEWGGRVLTHNGSNTMWFTVVWIAPEKNFAVLVATNVGGDAGARGTDEAAAALIADLLTSTEGGGR